MIRFVYYALILFLVYGCGGSNTSDKASPVWPDESFNPPRLVDSTAHGAGVGWGKSNCISCHPYTFLKTAHKYSPSLGESFEKVGADNTGVCLYCHGSNGIENLTADNYQCVLCHTENGVLHDGVKSSGAYKHDVNSDGIFNNADCLDCHKTSDMNGILKPDIDFDMIFNDIKTVNDFCLKCHGFDGFNGIYGPQLIFEKDFLNIEETFIGRYLDNSTADVHGYGIGHKTSAGTFRGNYKNNMVIPCISCHEVHTSKNPYLIAESGKNAVYSDDEGKNAVISTTEENFTELCAVCHTSPEGIDTPTTNNGLKEVYHSGPFSNNCTECHYHGAGYSAYRENLF